ncbi:MAG: CD225/dispanin family protein [Acidobacteriota bacterium]
MFAAKVDGLVRAGDINGAMEASKNAKTWSWVSLGVGIVWIIVVSVFSILPVFLAMMSNMPQ